MINKNTKLRIFTSFFLIFLFYLLFRFNIILVYTLLIFGVLSILEFLNLFNKIFTNKFYRYISNIIFIIYIFLFCYFFIFLSNFYQLKLIICSILVGCIASDIGGFVFGRTFKGPKLISISPNKTVFGSIGSLIFTCFAFSVSMFVSINQLNYKIIVISLIISIACQIGDLFISYLKRKANVKDTGNILPGHGGILDRIDGILLGIPFGLISLVAIY